MSSLKLCLKSIGQWCSWHLSKLLTEAPAIKELPIALATVDGFCCGRKFQSCNLVPLGSHLVMHVSPAATPWCTAFELEFEN